MLKKHLKLWFLVSLGSFIWSLTMVKSGLNYDFGLGFWGPNGHDGVWHIALAQSLSRGSFEMPTFAGSILQNYHVGFDLLLATFHKITAIPVTNLYFQIIPPIMAVLIGLLTYTFVINWKKSEIQALWAVFFVYFGGSWGWLLGKGESAFWSQQSISTLINPPFALSLVFLLLGLIFLQKKLNTKYLILSTLFFGVLIQIKAYAGILALGGLFIAGAADYLRHKKLNILKVFVGSAILSLVLFLVTNRLTNSVLIWQPFWFLETMMGLSDRLGWDKYFSAMTNYRMGNNIKAIPAYLLAFVVFWFGNLGTRLISIAWPFGIKEIKWQDAFIASIIIAGVGIPMLFVQKGTPWNTIQFLYYALFFSSILAGIVWGEFFEKANKQKALLFSGILVLLTIPTTFDTLKHYLPSRPPAKLSNAEVDALTFLSKQSEGVVLTYPFDKYKADEAVINPPRPLYLYESTAYVSAFANKSVFLEDEVNLNITGYSWQERKKQVEEFYKSLDQKYVYEFLRKNDISYIYWVKPQRATLGESQLGLERIFENSEVDIYKVIR